MGMISVWDGADLPPIGCDVLITHGRDDDLHVCTVEGYELRSGPDKAYHRVFINMKYKDKSTGNQRLLYEVYPLTYRKPS